MRIIKWLDEHFEETILLVMLILITIVMSAQILARYVFGGSMTWPEEFCRYCYIWTVFLSLGYTVRKGNMLRVNVVVDLFPTIVRNVVRLLADILMLTIFGLFFKHAIEYTTFLHSTGQVSPAMQVPMWMMYCATVLGFGMAIIRLVQAIIFDVKHMGDRAITTKEATLQEAQEEASAVLGGGKTVGGDA